MLKKNRSKPNGVIHPVDLHVGRRIDLRRRVLGVSQETLAGAIGVTFQQVQKYEGGHNRVSASRLYDIAKCLKVDTGYFFEELPATAGAGDVADPMHDTRAIEVVMRFNKLSERQQASILDLMKATTARNSG